MTTAQIRSPPKVLSKSASSSSTSSSDSSGSNVSTSSQHHQQPSPPKKKSSRPGSRPSAACRTRTKSGSKTTSVGEEATREVLAQPEELVHSIFSTIGRDLPSVTPLRESHDSTNSSSGEAAAAPAFDLKLDIDVDKLEDSVEKEEVEMNAMMMTKKVLDVEVEREKLFSNIILSQRDLKTLNDNATSTSKPSSRSSNRTRKSRRKIKSPETPDSEEEDMYSEEYVIEDSVINSSQSSANAAFAKFRMEHPNLDEDELLQSHGELSLASNSLNFNPDPTANNTIDTSVLGISFNSLSMNETSLEAINKPHSAATSPRVPNVDAPAIERGGGLALGSIESLGSDLMSFSIPNTPLDHSDMSLGDLGGGDFSKTVKKSNVGGKGADGEEGGGGVNAATKTPEIKGRLGNNRKASIKSVKEIADEEWANSMVNNCPTKPINKQWTVFGDAAIEAAIAASAAGTKPALTVAIPQTQNPQPPSTTSPSGNKDGRVWPGVAVPYATEDEGNTQRIEGTGRNNKRSRPSTRDSLGSISRLSVNNSIADLSIERMSLTNSAKSLSLDDSDWDLLASINQRMNGGNGTKENAVVVDPVAYNARVNSGMQMSELMKVGWELRPQALGMESSKGSNSHSRAGSAGSTGSFGLSLGLTGVVKSRIKNRKEEPPIVERPKAVELTIDGAYLDNLPSLPRKPTKPATNNKKAGKGNSAGGHRGRKVKRTESPTKRMRGNGAVSPTRQYVNIFDNISHNF